MMSAMMRQLKHKKKPQRWSGKPPHLRTRPTRVRAVYVSVLYHTHYSNNDPRQLFAMKSRAHFLGPGTSHCDLALAEDPRATS